MRFVRVEGRVNSAEHHVGAALTGYFADFVPAESIGRMDADADNVARLNLYRVHGHEGLIDKGRIAKTCRCRGGKDI